MKTPLFRRKANVGNGYDRSAGKTDGIGKFGRIRTMPQACHPEQAKRVEGSSNLRCAVQLGSAKILRLPSVAQDDRLRAFCGFAGVRRFWGLVLRNAIGVSVVPSIPQKRKSRCD